MGRIGFRDSQSLRCINRLKSAGVQVKESLLLATADEAVLVSLKIIVCFKES